MSHEIFLWSERNRPHTVADVILPEAIKSVFQGYVDKGEIPNLLLSGTGGVGKTTIARAMCDELELDYILINGSLNGGIDTLRNDISNFASSMSFSGKRKVVILDEADGLSAAFQPALRAALEDFSRSTTFILTANFKHRIIGPLHSRCSVVDFKIDKKEHQELMGQLFKRVCSFLKEEGVEFQKEAVASLINKHYPDCRRVWNELQRYASSGKIDSGILADFNEESYKTLVGYLKKKDFVNMRKWVSEQNAGDGTYLFRKIYDTASSVMVPASVPSMVLVLARYQDMATRVSDPEINTVAALTEIMADCDFNG